MRYVGADGKKNVGEADGRDLLNEFQDLLFITYEDSNHKKWINLYKKIKLERKETNVGTCLVLEGVEGDAERGLGDNVERKAQKVIVQVELF